MTQRPCSLFPVGQPLSVRPELPGMDQRSYPRESCPPEVRAPASPKSPSLEVRAPSPPKSIAADAYPELQAKGAPSSRAGFPDRVYAHAADIFRAAQVEKPLAPTVIRYGPSTLTRAGGTAGSNAGRNELWAYQLAFNALKYQELLEDMLTDSCFSQSQQTPDDLMALVVVMVYDFQDRKFLSREPMPEDGAEHIEEVRQVERSLCRLRTKLAASLARSRIKKNLPSIDDVLPTCVRAKHQRKRKLPIYAWVNTLKINVEEVCETLRAKGFVQGDPHTHLEGNMFSKDKHCPDVLRFSEQVWGLLEETTLVMDHKLIIQDKSRCLAVCAMRPLLARDADMLMVGSFSAQTVAHAAVQASACSASVYLCVHPDDPTQKEELEPTLSAIGCKNVRLLPGGFGGLREWDSCLQKVRAALLLPSCTASALCDPVAHILKEHGDRDLLSDLSRGCISDTKLQSLVSRQRRDLSHALTFPKIHAVVYCTCSVHTQENEELVKSVLEKAAVRPKLRPFRIVSTGWTEEMEERFFKLQESDTTDGCFLCVLKREQNAVEPESVQDILARAAAKGLLGGLIGAEEAEHAKPRERKRAGLRPARDAPPPISSPDAPPPISSPDAARLPGGAVQFPTAADGSITSSVANGLSGMSPNPGLKLTIHDPEDYMVSPSAVLDAVPVQDSGVQDNTRRGRSRAPRHARRAKTQPGSHPRPARRSRRTRRSQAPKSEPRDGPNGTRDDQERPGSRPGGADAGHVAKETRTTS